MTKISKTSAYPIKAPVKGDYFVGTDSESNGKTVNFSFEDAVALINNYNGTHIIDYKFRTDINIPLTVLTDGIFLSENNTTSVDSLTKLYINKNNIHEESKAELFQFIKNYNTSFYFRIQDSQDLNKLAYFNVDSIVDNTSHFIFNVAIDKRTQSISQLVDYKIYFLSFETKSTITKTSELINDGEGSSPFITAEEIPESGPSPWEIITSSLVGVLNKNYLTNNASKISITLPEDNSNKIIRVASLLGGWNIIIPSGWQILIADEVITQNIESTQDSDSIELLSLGNSKYRAINLIGNISFSN